VGPRLGLSAVMAIAVAACGGGGGEEADSPLAYLTEVTATVKAGDGL
jgi:hypothetical protein